MKNITFKRQLNIDISLSRRYAVCIDERNRTTLTKGDFMKKRVLAILMILVLATAGLFAAYTVTVPGTVTATLNSTIGEYLVHGFNVLGVKYQATVTVPDAFNATAPSFKYGYRTNAATGSFSFDMTVGDFINGTAGTVKIKDVVIASGTLSHAVGTRVYQVFSQSGTGVEKTGETTITIKPFLSYTANDTDITGTLITALNAADGAVAGDYVSTVSFSITAS